LMRPFHCLVLALMVRLLSVTSTKPAIFPADLGSQRSEFSVHLVLVADRRHRAKRPFHVDARFPPCAI
jgi:hypothetical protein